MSEKITSTELVTIPKTDLIIVFTQDGIDPILEGITKKVKEFVPDMTTPQGRSEIKSLAHNVAKSKAYLDGLGKGLVSEWKSNAKIVDTSRKKVREYLDDLKIIARKPLTDWENKEKDRVENHKRKIEHLKILSSFADSVGCTFSLNCLKENLKELQFIKIDDSWEEFSLQAIKIKQESIEILTEHISELEKYEVEKAELKKLREEKEVREKKEHEERIAKEAAERARCEAEEKARQKAELVEKEKQELLRKQKETVERTRIESERKAQVEADRAEEEKEDLIRKQKEADDRAKKAEQDKIESERREKQAKINAEELAKKAKQDRINAERRRLEEIKNAEIHAAEQKEIHIKQQKEAIENERLRVKKEHEKAQLEAQKREENLIHKKKINNLALDSLVKHAGLSPKDAQNAVKQIALKNIPGVQIFY